MIKDNVRIKKNITIVDDIAVIESIASSYFINGKYTPYYADIAKVIAIAKNFLDGVEFDNEDNVYDLVITNDDIYKLVKKFLVSSMNKSDVHYYEKMESIMDQVKDIVEHEKQKQIHNTDALTVVGNLCELILDIVSDISNMTKSITPENVEIVQKFMEGLQNKDITEETLTTAIRNAADQFKLSENDIIIKQRERIVEQQKQLEEKEADIKNLRKWKREHSKTK